MNSKIKDFYSNLSEQVKLGGKSVIVESGQGAYLTINGVKKLNFCSSHYLGFAEDPALKRAAKKAIDLFGFGTGYRTIVGTHTLHVELEEHLARFKHVQAAVVFSSGYIANLAALQTITDKDDIIFSDELNHASIIDAIRLSGVKNKFVYKHGDTADLEEKLKEAKKIAKTPKQNGKLPLQIIVTDGVFSMDGDLAQLPQIVHLAKKYGALTMVDDAHGEGVLGKGGRGIVDHFRLHGEVDIEVGTLSKAFSVIGGFITGKKELIDFYKMKARQFLFSIALPISDTAAILEAVKTLEKSDKRVKKLWDNTKYVKENFKKLGFDTGNSKTPITPVMLGSEELTLAFSNKLSENNILASAILFPMVAKGKARIRVIPSAAHSREDLDKGIEAFKKVAKSLKII